MRPARQPWLFVLDWISGPNPFTVAARHDETPVPDAAPDEGEAKPMGPA